MPSTVETALSDVDVEGRVCLEAGAGAGNATRGLLAADAARVYAVTNDREHARGVRDGVGSADRLAVLEADLREIPLPDDAVDVVTAHGLFNLLSPADASAVAGEVTRVAAPGCTLVVDDYEPLPDDAAVGDLFAVENAAASLATGEAALTFYPAEHVRRLFAGHGWEFRRERTLLDPVPWTESHVDAHADVARGHAAELAGGMREVVRDEIDRVADDVGSESVGEMYSVAMTLPA